MLRLLLRGDLDDRYVGRNDDDSGYRLTMALAVGASQPGRTWTAAEFHHALIYSPTSGGSWARRLHTRKGAAYAEGKLTSMLEKAQQQVASAPVITGRQSAFDKITQVRDEVERRVWTGSRGADTDLKNLALRLSKCEEAGGLDHELAVRPQAEQMGCGTGTAADSNRRLQEMGFLKLVASGAGTDRGSRWVLTCPTEKRAQPGHPPAPGTGGGKAPVRIVHNDTRLLAQIMKHDAFHRSAHGTNGARILTNLDVTEGTSRKELQDQLGLHRTTISRRLDLLVLDGLVVEREGLFYLPAGEQLGEGLKLPEKAVLDRVAERRGTLGAFERRKAWHASQRQDYRQWREAVARMQEARRQGRARLVPAGAVDALTGEILDPAWKGWNVSDPHRPVPVPEWSAQAA
ncbi:hypothetical protein [Streptomyces sp. NPDC097619]|uniref:hypothetical protein n=1 Tax=Streptomyces sp. NPDC097619 TaxID=3157228 RepID=UPI0033303810